MSLQITHHSHHSTQVGSEGVIEVVTVVGEVDVHTAPQLREKLRQVIDEQPRDVVVDIAGVPFMDSTALGVLVGALKRARLAGGTLRLAGPDPLASKILRVTGLVKVFSIHPDLANALGSPHPLPESL